MDCHCGLECGSGEVLTEAGWKELAEHSSPHDDQHQCCSRPCCVSDEAAETDTDDGYEAYAQGCEDQGLKNARRPEGRLEMLTGEDPLAHSEAEDDSRGVPPGRRTQR